MAQQMMSDPEVLQLMQKPGMMGSRLLFSQQEKNFVVDSQNSSIDDKSGRSDPGLNVPYLGQIDF